MYEEKIKSLKKYIMFIGTVRTGHNLIAALLNCQPKISISIEINPLLRFSRKISRNECFYKILNYCKKSTKFRKGGYNYKIKNTYQNNINNIEVIGDSMTNSKNTRLLYKNENLYKNFYNYVELPISKIWVIRNPFDVIQSHYLVNKENYSIDRNIKLHLELMNKTIEMYKRDKDNTLIVYLEKFISNVEEGLDQIFKFIDVSYDLECVKTCSKFVFSKPHKTFNQYDWTNDQVNIIKNFIKSNPELEYYKNEIF